MDFHPEDLTIKCSCHSADEEDQALAAINIETLAAKNTTQYYKELNSGVLLLLLCLLVGIYLHSNIHIWVIWTPLYAYSFLISSENSIDTHNNCYWWPIRLLPRTRTKSVISLCAPFCSSVLFYIWRLEVPWDGTRTWSRIRGFWHPAWSIFWRL